MESVIFNTSAVAGSSGMSLLANFCSDLFFDVSFKIQKLVWSCPVLKEVT